ncbi:MAG: hypothetical protein LBV04_05625, partial [Deferribacteraceae bacterium]|nr:hypothetical protein [Deferribacteraceae bacterium]
MNNAKLLRIKFNGLANIPEEGLVIDFLPQANINHDEYIFNRNFVKLENNLYYPKVIIMTGANATGKTTILELINYALSLATGSPIAQDYKFVPLIKGELRIELIAYSDSFIFKNNYNIVISKGKLESKLDEFYAKEYNKKDLKNIFSMDNAENIVNFFDMELNPEGILLLRAQKVDFSFHY